MANLAMVAFLFFLTCLLPRMGDQWVKAGVQWDQLSSSAKLFCLIEQNLMRGLYPPGEFFIEIILLLALLTSGIAFLLSFFVSEE
ncbi:MAG: hypothetical protein NTX50_21825 [Candidatus Sumerlaeota bacterium]|nr:hypothetical protein [Candidatus Sumerlaeota bacterium]